MAIPTTTNTVVEIVMKGIAAAAGSTAKNIANTYHFRRGASPLTLVKANIESAFQTAIGANVIALLNARYTQTFTSVRVVNDPLDQAVDFAEAGVGAISGDSMSSLDTAFCKIQTGIKGKLYRGNKKYGPMSESDSTTTSDVFNAGCIARFATLRTAFLAGFTDSDGNVWVPVLYSRKNDLLVTKPIVACADVTNFLLNKRIGKLSRREVVSAY